MSGYNSARAQTAAGITYRQLDHWARTGVVVPAGGKGQGNPRLYSAQDVAVLAIVKRLLDLGLTLDTIRALVDMREVNQRLEARDAA